MIPSQDFKDKIKKKDDVTTSNTALLHNKHSLEGHKEFNDHLVSTLCAVNDSLYMH